MDANDCNVIGIIVNFRSQRVLEPNLLPTMLEKEIILAGRGDCSHHLWRPRMIARRRGLLLVLPGDPGCLE